MEINRYLSGEYRSKNPTWHVQDSAWKASKILNMLAKHSIKPGSVWEIGCGAGEILAELQRHLPQHTKFCGYDISPDAHQLSAARSNENLEFHLADLFEQPLPYTPDVMLCIDVFEHVDDYFGFLRRLHGKGKWTIFHIPLNLSAQTVARKSFLPHARASVGHIHYFTKDTAIATLKDTGYEVIDYAYTAGSLELPGKRIRTRALGIPRRLLYKLEPDMAVRLLGGYSLLVLTR